MSREDPRRSRKDNKKNQRIWDEKCENVTFLVVKRYWKFHTVDYKVLQSLEGVTTG